MTHSILSIDPGTRISGYAVFIVDPSKKQAWLLESGTVEADTSKDATWLERAEQMVEEFDSLLEDHLVTRVVIELCQNWGGPASGGDSLIKLAVFIGALWGIVVRRGICGSLVKVSTWKGQVSKDITADRIKRRWGMEVHRLDESDAIGIGDWYLCKSLKYKAVKGLPPGVG